ncbi:MAG TPA: NAD(P)H-quinone dehydrogenase [Candidatus Lustribacter sp.]|nr:NAD(P)H-quinone dehydrogenase [Candidatus Lustribacter sp.]
MSSRGPSVVILGGGPGGYEAALVAAQLGARVTVVDCDGLGGAAVLTDCVPSKTLISIAGDHRYARLGEINRRILGLAQAQSEDIHRRLESDGVRIVCGTGRLVSPTQVRAVLDDGSSEDLVAEVVLVATGAAPRIMATAQPDGERILTWQQIYGLADLPERLVVVGSGVTGAKLAAAYLALGSAVTLVSSRDRVLPGEDADAAAVIEDVFRRNGMEVLDRSRMSSVERVGEEVRVHLEGGRVVTGTHALLALGSIPRTAGIGLAEAGVELAPSGHVVVDGVSRTSVRSVYAAGDCNGRLPLASVAAMQGRIAMWHALGDAVAPLRLDIVSANIFTTPEIATVGVSQKDVDSGRVEAQSVTLPLDTNARAKMDDFEDGFVKLFARPGTGAVLGGVIVAPRASELIYPVAMAVTYGLTVDQVAGTFTVYPSMTGSIAEAARRLHPRPLAR